MAIIIIIITRAILLLFLAIFADAMEESADEKSKHPDVGLTVIELIKKYGYPVEQHKYIETEDGYLLEMHRIPHGKNNSHVENKPAVLLMHGLLASSADWVNMGPGRSLAYLLADLGYDVWLGNARGNTWSRKHVVYNPNRDRAFWAFSWHEIGKYDLTRKIDYIIEKTGHPQIYYVGHSQGTTSFFVMASERPEYNEKIKLMVALSPVVYMSHMRSPFFQILSNFHNSIEWITKFLGVYEFLPNSNLFQLIGQIACNDDALFQEVCANILFLICGYDSAQLNRTMIPVITSSLPAGSSSNQLIHYAQGIKKGYFRQYDFGLIKNMIKYGQVKPPSYDLSKVTAPVALFYSRNDWLSSVTDVHQLYRELPNCIYKHQVAYDRFNHLDYMFAIDVIGLVYKNVFNLLSKF